MFDPYMMLQLLGAMGNNPMDFATAMGSTGAMPPMISEAPMLPGAPPMMPGGSPAIATPPPPMPAAPMDFTGTPQVQPTQALTPDVLSALMMGQSPATLGGGAGGPMGAAGPAMAPGINPMNALGMAGRALGTGSSDQRPIMSGGVSGAQKAPEATAFKGGSQSAVTQALMALLAGGGAPVGPLALGRMIGG